MRYAEGKLRPLVFISVGILWLVMTCGCISGNDLSSSPDMIGGTVVYQSLEGGFYGIVDEDGKEYLPLNIDNEYKVDGLHIRFTATEKSDAVTIYMWGTPVEITSIEKTE